MKHLILFLLCGFIVTLSYGQSNNSELFFGKYEGTEIVFFKLEPATEDVDLNNFWGKKNLTINRDGSFSLEFPDRWPRQSQVQKRYTKGRWLRTKDTLILKSHYTNSDYIKVEEYKTDSNHIQVQVAYADKGKYYPDLSVSINNQKIDTRYNPWTYFPLDTVALIQIDRRNAASDREWIYRTTDKNSNRFVISLTDNIKGNNYVLEEYRLLIVGSSLVQIDKLFDLRGNCYKATNFR